MIIFTRYKDACLHLWALILLIPSVALCCSEKEYFADTEQLHSQKITVIGTGYVGLVLGAGLAEMGNEVICADIDEGKIEYLINGGIPIYEPGLSEVVAKNVKEGRLHFSHNISQSIQNGDIIFIAVGTPTALNGDADVSAVEAVAATIGKNLNKYKLICLKSTVPIGVTRKIGALIAQFSAKNFDIAFNPEFLREGKALDDFFNPDRIVIGVENHRAEKILEDIYSPFTNQKIPLLKTNIATAEAIKYASNSFLAVKISFINEFANLCEVIGADIVDVAKGIGLDKRIGSDFLKPGPGFGGSCFPKDTLAILHKAKNVGVDLKITQAAVEVNEVQSHLMVQKLCRFWSDLNGKTIAILGLAFKAHTDDVRSSPAISIIKEITQAGGRVKAYDPKAMSNMKEIMPDIDYYNTLFDAVKESDAAMILTDWEEFQQMDLTIVHSLMNTPILIDTRNLLNPHKVKNLGFAYDDVGRLKN